MTGQPLLFSNFCSRQPQLPGSRATVSTLFWTEYPPPPGVGTDSPSHGTSHRARPIMHCQGSMARNYIRLHHQWDQTYSVMNWEQDGTYVIIGLQPRVLSLIDVALSIIYNFQKSNLSLTTDVEVMFTNKVLSLLCLKGVFWSLPVKWLPRWLPFCITHVGLILVN